MPVFRPNLYFIVGPTAVGKTALSLACAERLGADILSCDSLCVYRGMDIGTAKPTAAERAVVPHYGIDLVDPATPYSVDSYAQYAHEVVEACAARGRHVLVVGGSGFYLKSFFAPVSDGIEIPPEVETQVERHFEQEGLPGLLRKLKPFDPDDLADLDRRNPRRVIKALQRCLATDEALIDLQRAFAMRPEPFIAYRKQVCLLARESEDLRGRVRRRVADMFTAGLLGEVETLRKEGIERNPSASRAIGYRETLEYLRECSGIEGIETLQETIAVHTDQLIRKQRIWFRRQIPVHTTIAAETATVEDAFPEVNL